MENNRPYKITAVLCTLMLGAGISISAVLYCLVVRIEKIIVTKSDIPPEQVVEINARICLVGLLYAFPAVIGFISACSKSRGCYIAHMVIEIIALVIGGILFVAGVILLIVGTSNEFDIHKCISIGDTCTCSSESFNVSCDSVKHVVSFMYGLAACFVIGWIICLIDTIHTGMVACRSRVNSGALLIASKPDTAVLVHNWE